MPPRAYVICATPRSGSTLLCDLLAASGAGRPASYFRREDIGYWAGGWGVPEPDTPAAARRYLEAMKRAGRGYGDLFGLRLMWNSVGDARRLLGAAPGGDSGLVSLLEGAFGPTLFIHLSREDKIEQATSLVRAQQTGLWHRHADGSERERLAPACAPVFDPKRLRRTRDDLARDDAAWGSLFAERGATPLRVRYEALSAEPSLVLGEVLTALGRDPAVVRRVAPRTARLADEVTRAWVERLRSA